MFTNSLLKRLFSIKGTKQRTNVSANIYRPLKSLTRRKPVETMVIAVSAFCARRLHGAIRRSRRRSSNACILRVKRQNTPKYRYSYYWRTQGWEKTGLAYFPTSYPRRSTKEPTLFSYFEISSIGRRCRRFSPDYDKWFDNFCASRKPLIDSQTSSSFL